MPIVGFHGIGPGAASGTRDAHCMRPLWCQVFYSHCFEAYGSVDGVARTHGVGLHEISEKSSLSY